MCTSLTQSVTVGVGAPVLGVRRLAGPRQRLHQSFQIVRLPVRRVHACRGWPSVLYGLVAGGGPVSTHLVDLVVLNFQQAQRGYAPHELALTQRTYLITATPSDFHELYGGLFVGRVPALRVRTPSLFCFGRTKSTARHQAAAFSELRLDPDELLVEVFGRGTGRGGVGRGGGVLGGLYLCLLFCSQD